MTNKFSAPAFAPAGTVRPLAAALLLALSGAASAGEVSADLGSARVATSVPSATAKARPLFAGPGVSERLLARSRGGSATAVVDESGSLQQTSASNVQTGSNAIGGASFANALGLTTVIQNSGANVLIQNATTINVQFK